MADTVTLRSGISDLVNDLQKIALDSDDPEVQTRIQYQVRALMLLWQEVIFESLNSTSADYKAAIKSVNQAKVDAAAAVRDIQQIAAAIDKAAKAIKKIDKLLGFTAKLVGKSP